MSDMSNLDDFKFEANFRLSMQPCRGHVHSIFINPTGDRVAYVKERASRSQEGVIVRKVTAVEIIPHTGDVMTELACAMFRLELTRL